MNNDRISAQCEVMTDRGLVRALTVDSEEYTGEFHETARRELKKRRVTVSEFIDTVRVRMGNRGEEVHDVRGALSRLKLPVSLGIRGSLPIAWTRPWWYRRSICAGRCIT